MQKSKQLILVALESAEAVLAEKWMEEGHLPNLKRLRSEGVWSRISSPAYISSGCVWPSLTVGVNPGKHGFVFFHRQLKNGTYRIVKRYSDQVPFDYFWIPLSKADKRVAIMDVPLTRPQKELNGAFFCNWGDEHPGWKPDSIPKSLLPELIQKFGQHPLHEWYQFNPDSIEDWKVFRDKLQKGVQQRTKLSRYMLGKEKWDFAFINFSEPHWAGHMAWHIHDETHPQHDSQLRKECGDIIRQNFVDLDSALGEIAKDNPDANLMVISHIGMTGQTGGELLTEEILGRLGLSGQPKGKKKNKGLMKTLMPGSMGISAAVQNIESLISPKLMTAVKKAIPERLWDDWTRRFLSMGTNWSNSKAFLVPGDHASLIRVNLQGREPKGKVAPGQEYKQLLSDIADAFNELKDVETGKPAVARIEYIQDTIWGDYADEFPDLAIIWREGSPLEAIESERLGRIELKEFHKRSGGHNDNGFFIFHGPDFKKGMELDSADTLDIVPTIFSLLNVSAPDYIDGKSLFDTVTNHEA